MAKVARGPKFVQFFDPVLRALKELGGSGRPTEVMDIVARIKSVTESERTEPLSSGKRRFDNKVHFARQYLVWGGYIDSSKRGVWSLTEKGLSCPGLNDTEAIEVFREQHSLHASAKETDDESLPAINGAPALESPVDHRTKLLETLQSLPPSGFERLCQRLLRESDFEHVTVTGRSGDGGIDGIGVVKVNAFVAFKVLFQCKRYVGSVGSSQVRDFRGAMQGRADKGMILTTGTFTRDARAEAVRDGVPPIELVDGDGLLDLFEKLELGLIPRTTYDVDTSFFEQFRSETPAASAEC